MKRLVEILQLDHKWVRVMLGTSTMLILIILFSPLGMKKEVMLQSEEYPAPAMADSLAINYDVPIMDTTFMRNDSIKTRILIRRQPTQMERHMPAPPPPPASANKSNYEEDTTFAASEPFKIQIVKEKEPFDWKGTITWAIGAMNGFVLIILNIKNLIFKKNP
jgi:hypothetical protein